MVKKKIIILMALILFLMICIYELYYLNNTYGIGMICIYNKFTGLQCPGCGMTRAVFSLLKLDFYQAIRYNAFSVIAIPIILLYCISGACAWVFDKPNFMEKRIPPVVWIILIVSLLLYGVLRNIPMFSFLAPTVV